MKLNKIFAIALAALTLTACSDDDDEVITSLNTAPATVSMQKNTMSISEDVVSGVYYKVPVVVEGTTNGVVRVTIEASAVGNSPATEDVDYLFTQKTITIPAGQNVGEFEFYPVGDDEINEDRQFVVTITNVEGATLAENKTCEVTLIDNEKFVPMAYAKIQGQWLMNAGEGDVPFEIEGYDESDPRYLKEVMTRGWFGYSYMEASARVLLDATTMEVTLQFPIGQMMAEGKVEFTNLGIADVVLCGFDGTYYYTSGNVTFKSNPEQTMFVNEGLGILCGVYQNGTFQGGWHRATSMTLTRP